MAIHHHAESETATCALPIPAQLRKAFMQVIRSPADAADIADAAIRKMILQRIDAIASDEPYDATQHGYFLAVEAGDTLQGINKQVGFDLLAKPYEILEEYQSAYDLLYIVCDDGFGIEVFIPKAIDIPELIAMCKRYAVPVAC